MLTLSRDCLHLCFPDVRSSTFGLLLGTFAMCTPGGAAPCKEMGRLQSFGSQGRLFSAGRSDYVLLSRQSYRTEDSSGYEGRIRRLGKDEGGGRDMRIRYYVARCITPFDNWTYVAWYDDADYRGTRRLVDIRKPNRFPGDASKDSYNLYWAACHGQFRKFK